MSDGNLMCNHEFDAVPSPHRVRNVQAGFETSCLMQKLQTVARRISCNVVGISQSGTKLGCLPPVMAIGHQFTTGAFLIQPFGQRLAGSVFQLIGPRQVWHAVLARAPEKVWMTSSALNVGHSALHLDTM